MATPRIKREQDWENGLVSFTELATNENFVADVKPFFPDYANLPEIGKRLACHSVNAKAGDSASDPDKPAIPQIRDTYNALVAGTWSQRGDGSGPRTTDLAVAVFNVMMARGQTTTPDGQEVTQDLVNTAVADWSDDRKKEMRSDPDVSAEIKRLRAERAAADAKAAQKAAKAKAKDDTTPATISL